MTSTDIATLSGLLLGLWGLGFGFGLIIQAIRKFFETI
jgi:hypothetical protein